VRVVALSGGYTRDDACVKLSRNKDMIASFSRALVEDLTYQMSDGEFDKSLAHSIDEIFKAESGRRPMAGSPAALDESTMGGCLPAIKRDCLARRRWSRNNQKAPMKMRSRIERPSGVRPS
jgi:hypothetical protein